MKSSILYFINVAKDIGEEDGSLVPGDHPSIQAIRANISSTEPEFNFKLVPVDEAKVTGYLGRVGLGKATGLDTISS